MSTRPDRAIQLLAEHIAALEALKMDMNVFNLARVNETGIAAHEDAIAYAALAAARGTRTGGGPQPEHFSIEDAPHPTPQNTTEKKCECCGHFAGCHQNAGIHVELGCTVKGRCCQQYVPPPETQIGIISGPGVLPPETSIGDDFLPPGMRRMDPSDYEHWCSDYAADRDNKWRSYLRSQQQGAKP